MVRAVKRSELGWTSFVLHDQAVNEILEDPKEVVSEREAWELAALQSRDHRTMDSRIGIDGWTLACWCFCFGEILYCARLPRIIIGLLQQQVGNESALSNIERASGDVCSIFQINP